MAGNTDEVPLQCFRFSVQFGLGEDHHAFTSVSIDSNGPWRGPGRVVLTKYMGSHLLSLMKKLEPIDIIVSAYDRDSDGEPALTIALKGCNTGSGSISGIKFSATGSEFLTASLTADYESMEVISGSSPLELLALAAD